jgi:cytochrome c-type biogenesis protein CcmH/NrfG
VSVTATALLAAGAVFGLRETAAPTPAPAAARAHPDRLAETIFRAQDRLRRLPRDHETWAALGLAYVERARVTADPGLYPKAEGALRRSRELRAIGNPVALVGFGALANARHEFAAARGFATAALRDNPYDAEAYGVLADAHTQLGDASAATAAIQRMLDLRPGLAAYARASYDLEQHGRLPAATELMRRALGAAVDPADIAFCRRQLGDLACPRATSAARPPSTPPASPPTRPTSRCCSGGPGSPRPPGGSTRRSPTSPPSRPAPRHPRP